MCPFPLQENSFFMILKQFNNYDALESHLYTNEKEEISSYKSNLYELKVAENLHTYSPKIKIPNHPQVFKRIQKYLNFCMFRWWWV